MKDTAVFCRAWFEAAADLPPADFKELFLSLADYAFNGADPADFALLCGDLSPVARAIFTLARPVMRKNAERWEARAAEAGRPPLELTTEDAQRAVKVAGSVKGAAELLGVSVRTMHRRLSVPKCQNAKNVNVNVNVNENVSHTFGTSPKVRTVGAVAGHGQASDGLAPPPPAPCGERPWADFESEEAQRKMEAIFESMRRPFVKHGYV